MSQGQVVRALLPALLVLALAPAGAAADVIAVSHHGGFKATLDYHRGSNGLVADRLVIARNGRQLFAGKPRPRACRGLVCSPTVGFGRPKPLRIVDYMDEDDPVVLLTYYTGGAHCCFVGQVFALNGKGSAYRPTADRNFGDSGFRLRDVGHDGTLEFVSVDWRFDYAFTAYAFSGKPIQIFRYASGRFRDMTSSFPRLIRRDARRFLRIYRKVRHRKDGAELGMASAWAADKYRLGQRDPALTFLQREAERGLLKPDGVRFIRKLDRFLLRLGYS